MSTFILYYLSTIWYQNEIFNECKRLNDCKMLKAQRPKSLVDQIYRSICQGIMDGSLKPGQPIREQELQRNFSVSRAPIREAIRLLEADRLIVFCAYKKKYVRRISRDDLAEVIPVLACLEGCAAKIAALKLEPEELQTISEINEKMRKNYQAGNQDECNELNFEFHGAYVGASENEAVKQAIRPMVKRIIRLWVTTLYTQKPDLFRTTIREHDKIIEAFIKRDAEEAEKAARTHVENLLARALTASAFDDAGNFKIETWNRAK